MDDLYAFWLIIRGGVLHIHPLPFAAVALAFGLVTRSAPLVIPAALAGSAVYVLVNALVPTMTEGAPFLLPRFHHAFWYFFMSLSIAMAVAVGFLYGLKTALMHARG